MSNKSTIEWTDKTLNPVRGCTRVSPGCAECYFHREVERLKHNPNGSYANGVRPTFHPDVLRKLEEDREPSRYFVGSMSDWLHEEFPDEVVFTLLDALRRADHHWYFLLTKRSERLASLGPYLDWPDHVIACVSVESGAYLHRIEHLRASGAKRMGVSFEPLLGRVPLNTPEGRRLVRGLDHAIVGGETAKPNKVRRMHGEWAREIRDVCLEEGVPFCFKQWGSVDEEGAYVGKKKAGRSLDGRFHDDLPRGCAEHLERARLIVVSNRLRRPQDVAA